MLIDLKNGNKLVHKLVGVAIEPEEIPGQIVARISTTADDSDGDTIFQGPNDKGAGWLLERYNKHPVMLWMHDHMRPSMGKSEAFLAPHDGGSALHARSFFDQEDEFARQIESKVRRGVLSETSVGFMATKYGFKNETDPWDGINFYEQELIEYSWVNRGANPDTESFIKSACISCPEVGKLIQTFESKELIEMKNEFLSRMEAVDSQIKIILEQMAGQVRDARVHQPDDAGDEWGKLANLAEEISKTQSAFRGVFDHETK